MAEQLQSAPLEDQLRHGHSVRPGELLRTSLATTPVYHLQAGTTEESPQFTFEGFTWQSVFLQRTSCGLKFPKFKQNFQQIVPKNLVI